MTNLQNIAKTKKSFQSDRLNLLAILEKCLTYEDILSKWYLKRYLTKGNVSKNKNHIDLLKKELIFRYDTRKSKEIQNEIDLINAIYASGSINEIRINIEWAKNRTWGSNPTATAKIYGDKYENFASGSIGGCGYDKESTAFCEAINQSLAFQKLLLTNSKKLGKIYGFSGGKLSHGVGVSCYYSIFEAIGYKMDQVGSGKMFASYLITKK